MSAYMSASLAFAAAAALGTVQLRTRLAERRVDRRMRELAGVVPMELDTRTPMRIDLPHPMRERRQRKRNALLSSQIAPALELIVGHLRIGRAPGRDRKSTRLNSSHV